MVLVFTEGPTPLDVLISGASFLPVPRAASRKFGQIMACVSCPRPVRVVPLCVERCVCSAGLCPAYTLCAIVHSKSGVFVAPECSVLFSPLPLTVFFIPPFPCTL